MRARRDFVRRFPRPLEQAADLLFGLFERVPDRCAGRGARLDLRDQAIDTFDVRVDGPSVVTADRCREGDVQDFRRDVMSKLAESLLLVRLALWLVALPLVIAHFFPFGSDSLSGPLGRAPYAPYLRAHHLAQRPLVSTPRRSNLRTLAGVRFAGGNAATEAPRSHSRS